MSERMLACVLLFSFLSTVSFVVRCHTLHCTAAVYASFEWCVCACSLQ